jgi:SAM-dependent methyltransferase
MVRHWSELTKDPNSEPAREFRRKTLAAAVAEPVLDRMTYLCGLVKGRRILDVGVVGHTLELRGDDERPHARLAKAAARCKGVDIIPDEVEELRRRGFDVICHDILAQPLPEKFEFIICGEVIEHLGNPAALFTSAAAMLEPGGTLVLTTPNPYFANLVHRHHRGDFHESVDHVTYVPPSGAAELAERVGMRLVRYRGILRERISRNFLARWEYKRRLARHGLQACEPYVRNWIYECRLDSAPGL